MRGPACGPFRLDNKKWTDHFYASLLLLYPCCCLEHIIDVYKRHPEKNGILWSFYFFLFFISCPLLIENEEFNRLDGCWCLGQSPECKRVRAHVMSYLVPRCVFSHWKVNACFLYHNPFVRSLLRVSGISFYDIRVGNIAACLVFFFSPTFTVRVCAFVVDRKMFIMSWWTF